MKRRPFTFSDLCEECEVLTSPYSLDGQDLGVKILIPTKLQSQYPFNTTAYGFLQQLRNEIFEFGTIEFPQLQVNKTNHTLAQRAPHEHHYSDNHYLTGHCQHPHQDTPPLPSAFWLGDTRRFYSTWIISKYGLQQYLDLSQSEPSLSELELHKRVVTDSINNHSGLLLNREPGLLLIDNSNHRSLYHSRTCNFATINEHNSPKRDTPMYAYNETGLLHYIDILDSRRGSDHRCDTDRQEVIDFLNSDSNQ
ncbi:hypothetical protein A9Q99_23420 [Gammaproteobacteria bacterium 45_16_T64]|nr:hypothetical protein A9Q99_23420 [Gammaproteobacteria bacterium 45_16_T64]